MAGFIRITDLAAASTLIGDELLEVSQVSTTVRKVGTTINAHASDNSFRDSADGFLTAGFAVGDRVRVTGFTSHVANNIAVGVITAVTAGIMNIGGADGDVIVNESAGPSVTIAKWTSRKIAASTLTSEGSGYDIGVFLSGTVLASELVFRLAAVRAFSLPASFTGSLGSAVVASTGTAVFSIRKNGTQFGTLTFTTSASGVFSGSATSFAVTDLLTIIGPGTADGTLSDISINLKGSVV